MSYRCIESKRGKDLEYTVITQMLFMYLLQFCLLIMGSEEQCVSKIGRITNPKEDKKKGGAWI